MGRYRLPIENIDVRYALEPLAKLLGLLGVTDTKFKLTEVSQANVRHASACRRDPEGSR
jgi:hypothetical protein